MVSKLTRPPVYVKHCTEVEGPVNTARFRSGSEDYVLGDPRQVKTACYRLVTASPGERGAQLATRHPGDAVTSLLACTLHPLRARSTPSSLARVTIGSIVGRRDEAEELVRSYIESLKEARARTEAQSRRPRVYFEEWDDPRITAIEWVGELIELAGGQNIFAEKSSGKLASERFVDDEAILSADPEIIAASWCGKKVDIDSIKARPGYDQLTAVKQDAIVELDPSIILQPGPACLTAGLQALEAIIRPT